VRSGGTGHAVGAERGTARRPFTAFLLPRQPRSPRGYRARSDHQGMADVLVVAAIVVFVAAMLGLIKVLERL
jgi:hypothetical protein